MSGLRNTIRDELAEQRRVDAEFSADFRAGRLPDLNPTPLDPATDPFGTGYAWLTTPEPPFDAALGSLLPLPADVWYQVGGPELRTAALGGALASGTDAQIFRGWVDTQFVALCQTGGEDGLELLRTLRTERETSADTLHRVVMLLESVPTFAALGQDQLVAAALIVTTALRPE